MELLDLTVYVLYPTALAVGLLIGGLLAWQWGRRIDRSNPPRRPSTLAWVAMGLGIAAAACFLLSVISGMFPAVGWLIPTSFQTLALATGTSAVITAFTAVARRDRHWPTWVAIGAAAVPFLTAVNILMMTVISLLIGNTG